MRERKRLFSTTKAMLVVVALCLPLLICAPSQADELSRWSFSPPVSDFGVRVPGTGPSAPKAFTLTNTGNVSLSADWTGLNWAPDGGPDPELFEITSDDCHTLAPEESCTIEIAFNPSRPGPKKGALTVADVEPSPKGASATAYLEGTGAGQAAALAPELVRFEPFMAGAGPSGSQVVTLSNEGQLDLQVSSISLTNQKHFDADQFQITGGTCRANAIVSPGGACTIRVAFAPTAGAEFSADLSVADNAPDSPQLVTLEGDGLAPSPGPPLRAFILSHPRKRTAKRGALFHFKGSAGAASFECRLDSHPFSPCGSPARFRHLPPGSHRFAVRAVAGEGGRESAAAQFRWTVAAG